jgi:hypothetical protein
MHVQDFLIVMGLFAATWAWFAASGWLWQRKRRAWNRHVAGALAVANARGGSRGRDRG